MEFLSDDGRGSLVFCKREDMKLRLLPHHRITNDQFRYGNGSSRVGYRPPPLQKMGRMGNTYSVLGIFPPADRLLSEYLIKPGLLSV